MKNKAIIFFISFVIIITAVFSILFAKNYSNSKSIDSEWSVLDEFRNTLIPWSEPAAMNLSLDELMKNLEQFNK